MSALGARATFRTRTDDRVEALCTEERNAMPIFDVEIVRDGEVIEYLPHVYGHSGLMALAER